MGMHNVVWYKGFISMSFGVGTLLMNGEPRTTNVDHLKLLLINQSITTPQPVFYMCYRKTGINVLDSQIISGFYWD